MTSFTVPTAESPDVQGPCEVGECGSCGATVLVIERDETKSLDLYGPRERCECGGSQFRRVSVDEALK